MLSDGWYLMSTETLMRELARFRSGDEMDVAPDVQPLTIDEALAYRNAGNLPDSTGRTLRLVLGVGSEDELHSLEQRRRVFEPDFLDPPSWRREGSKPVNVVPLRRAEVRGVDRPWWEDPEVGELEAEWQRQGTAAGLRVPGEFRSFVYKTVLALRAAGRKISTETVLDGVARWLSPQQVEELRAAFALSDEEPG